METMVVDGLTLFFDAQEREAAGLVRDACEKSIRLIRECWGLDTPADCRVYVMTSWLHFVFHSAPWPWRILLGISMPLWYYRVKKTWPFAGGWAQRYGKRRAVGIKPPRLIQQADRAMGELIFVQEADISEKVQHVTCHELTHAFAGHLGLPMWLNEGLAMVTVDRFAGKPTVRHRTLDILGRWSGKASPGRYRDVSPKDRDALVYHAVRGYWITRYVGETQPGLLKGLLSRRQSHRALEDEVAAALGMDHAGFWENIDSIVVSYFEQKEGGQ